MATRVNLDFFAPPPERQQRIRERRAQQRAPMFSWRHDFSESCFSPISGRRRPLKHVFNPVARERAVGTPNAPSEAHNGTGVRHRNSPLRDLKRGGAGRSRSAAARPATTAVWQGAAGCSIDRRRRWKQSGFTFPKDYFGRTAHFLKPLNCGAGTDPSGAQKFNGSSSIGGKVFVPYLHDTVLLCQPQSASTESRGGNDGGERLGTPAGSKHPMSGQHMSSIGGVVLAVTCNSAESRAKEYQASMDAQRAELLGSFKTPSSTQRLHEQQQQQQSAAAYSGEAATLNHASNLGGTTSADGHMHLEPEPWYEAVGPSIAVKQRAAAIAEGVYADLILARANTSSAAATARVPTCELAYALRPSYVQSRLRRSAALCSSDSSLNATASGMVPPEPYAASRERGTSRTTHSTTVITSPTSAPRTHRSLGNGASPSPSERTATRSPGNESATATVPPTVTEAPLTDPNSISYRGCSVDDRNNNMAVVSPTDVASDVNLNEETRRANNVGARSTSKASAAPVGDTQICHGRGSGCASSPPDEATAPSRPGVQQHRRRRECDPTATPCQSPHSERRRKHVASAAQRGHPVDPESFTMHGLPTESKETRIYAVRVSASFTNRDAPLLKSAEPQRAGMPVMLPPDW